MVDMNKVLLVSCPVCMTDRDLKVGEGPPGPLRWLVACSREGCGGTGRLGFGATENAARESWNGVVKQHGHEWRLGR